LALHLGCGCNQAVHQLSHCADSQHVPQPDCLAQQLPHLLSNISSGNLQSSVTFLLLLCDSCRRLVSDDVQLHEDSNGCAALAARQQYARALQASFAKVGSLRPRCAPCMPDSSASAAICDMQLCWALRSDSWVTNTCCTTCRLVLTRRPSYTEQHAYAALSAAVCFADWRPTWASEAATAAGGSTAPNTQLSWTAAQPCRPPVLAAAAGSHLEQGVRFRWRQQQQQQHCCW
jgi:hypothetical protein